MLDVAIVGARFLQFISATVLFGSALFYLYGLTQPFRHRLWQGRLLFAAGIVALISVAGTIMLQAASLGDGAKSAVDRDFLWSMLTETGFGKIFIARLALSLASLAAFLLFARGGMMRLAIVQTILGAGLVASFAWTGHAVVEDGAVGAVHMASDVMHLLAAGVWVGALFPLAILLGNASAGGQDLTAIHDGLERFSGIGVSVVAVLIFSGIVNSWFLIGPSHALELFTTLYGLVLLLKLALFAAMLILAAANRFRLVPNLAAALGQGAPAAASVAALKTSVLMETVLAVLVLIAVSLLGTLIPPASMG